MENRFVVVGKGYVIEPDGERNAVGYFNAVLDGRIEDGLADAVELDDACDGGGGPLEVVELLREAIDGHHEHLGVMEDQVDGAEGNQVAEVEIRPQGQGYGAADAEHEHRSAEHDAAHEAGF